MSDVIESSSSTHSKPEEAPNADLGSSSSTSIRQWQLITTFFSITSTAILYSIVNGMITVEIPTIARDIGLDQNLLLWPQSISSIVTACTLLLCGSLVDVVGGKRIYLAGCVLQTGFILASGLARTTTELFVSRAFMGLAQSMCLPSSVHIITETFPRGRIQNLAFACMGGGQPLGFSLGLILGGVLTSTIGWRFGLYLVAGLNLGVSIISLWGLQSTSQRHTRSIVHRILTDIDWLGVFIASTFLATFCYVLASITGAPSNVKRPYNITLLTISGCLPFAFFFWMRYRVQAGQPALIPNSLWRNIIFFSVCISVFFTWGAFNSLEQLLALWMQIIQHTSPLQTGIRFLPQPVVDVIANLIIGFFVHRISSGFLVVVFSIFSLVAPILMALSNPRWVYWAALFPSLSLNGVGADALYTISNILILREFPQAKQGLAGGVFNTMAQVGKSLGLALSAVISSVVTQNAHQSPPADAETDGYRAGFWFCLGLNAISLSVSAVGLRKVGRIGGKED